MDTGTDSEVPTTAESPDSNANAVAAWARSAAEFVEQEDVHRPVVVAIDGPAGAGKTSLAALVVAVLGDASVVHMDDLYPGWDGLARAIPLLAEKVLAPVSCGERAWYPRYDWTTGAYAEAVIVPFHRYLLIEGVGASAGMAREYADVRVWLRAPESVRRDRAEHRDAGGFGSNWERWARQETELFSSDRTQEHAHLIVDTA